jgi:hypothetical protein
MYRDTHQRQRSGLTRYADFDNYSYVGLKADDDVEGQRGTKGNGSCDYRDYGVLFVMFFVFFFLICFVFFHIL